MMSKVLQDREKSGCPCVHTTPCHPRCTCKDPFSSVGCKRCCSYGSPQQQHAQAQHLARCYEHYESVKAALAAAKVETNTENPPIYKSDQYLQGFCVGLLTSSLLSLLWTLLKYYR
jgi:hypothetical protein